jgi:hypothetical protein
MCAKEQRITLPLKLHKTQLAFGRNVIFNAKFKSELEIHLLIKTNLINLLMVGDKLLYQVN